MAQSLRNAIIGNRHSGQWVEIDASLDITGAAKAVVTGGPAGRTVHGGAS